MIFSRVGSQFGSLVHWTVSRVVAAATSSTMARMSDNGRPPQFMEMKLNRRCSILFHFKAPGGQWQTVIASAVSAENVSPVSAENLVVYRGTTLM